MTECCDCKTSLMNRDAYFYRDSPYCVCCCPWKKHSSREIYDNLHGITILDDENDSLFLNQTDFKYKLICCLNKSLDYYIHQFFRSL